MCALLGPQEKAALLSSTLGAWLSQVLFRPRVLRWMLSVDGGGGGSFVLIGCLSNEHEDGYACLDDVLLYWQSVLRPADDPRMDAAICAIVDFVEGPTVGGSRDWPMDAVMELFADPETVLPDLGVAPNALLKAAIALGTAATPDTGSTTVEEWLLVGDCGCAGRH